MRNGSDLNFTVIKEGWDRQGLAFICMRTAPGIAFTFTHAQWIGFELHRHQGGLGQEGFDI
jgi:hypothetical protein